jgi:CHAD domain-containing protein
LEVEAKFRIPDEGTFKRLRAADIMAGFRLGEVDETPLYDWYLDTAGRALLSAGYACRLRRHGERYLGTLKGLGQAEGAIHRREEIEIDLPGPLLPDQWPSGPARDLVLRLCGSEPLQHLFELEQIRHSRLIFRGSHAIADLALDRVKLFLDGTLVDTSAVLEIEIMELGGEDELDSLVACMEREWGLKPEPLSKFEWAWNLLELADFDGVQGRVTAAIGSTAAQAPVRAGMDRSDEETGPVQLLEAPGLEADDPMSEAGRKVLRFHFRRMLYNEPGTRLGQDIEALHDMRVATRRMRAAFQVYGDHYEPKSVASFRKGLKRTGRALGGVRDLDVFGEKLHLYLATLPADRQDDLDTLLAALDLRREAARQRMVAYLDGAKYARFRDRFGEFLETEGLGSRLAGVQHGEPNPYRVRHVAPVSIYERLAAVRAYDEWVSIPRPPLERLHQLRIACKRLRYAIEFFREILGPEAKAAIREIVKVQDHLGALQDSVVASAILTEFLRSGAWGPGADPLSTAPGSAKSEPGVESLLAAKQAEMQHLLATFPSVWQSVKSAEFSRMIAETVVVL